MGKLTASFFSFQGSAGLLLIKLIVCSEGCVSARGMVATSACSLTRQVFHPAQISPPGRWRPTSSASVSRRKLCKVRHADTEAKPSTEQGSRTQVVQFHKPSGLVTSRAGQHASETVYDALRGVHVDGVAICDWHCVGRLDKETSGCDLADQRFQHRGIPDTISTLHPHLVRALKVYLSWNHPAGYCS